MADLTIERIQELKRMKDACNAEFNIHGEVVCAGLMENLEVALFNAAPELLRMAEAWIGSRETYCGNGCVGCPTHLGGVPHLIDELLQERDALKAELAGLLRSDPLKAGVEQEREILALKARVTELEKYKEGAAQVIANGARALKENYSLRDQIEALEAQLAEAKRG